MCYTCHDGTATNVGQSTAFNTVLQQHKIASGEDCDMCHTVHDNTNGMFMKVAKQQNSYCAACHNAAINAGGLGDYTASGNHPSYWTSPPAHNTGAACGTCHNMHDDLQRANSCYLCHEKGHGAVDYSTTDVANPILRKDNTDSAYCASCHPVNTQTTTAGKKHPANLDVAGTWGKVDCESCHDPHQAQNPNFPFVLRNQNIDSAYCVYCHDETDETNGPKIGISHPQGVSFTTPPTDPGKSPAGNTIDDDDINGIDYPANSENIVCESCHSTHRKAQAAPLLRLTIDGSVLCLNCHSNI
jgi:predicted CXXCH cytochrome family protein